MWIEYILIVVSIYLINHILLHSAHNSAKGEKPNV